MARPSRFVDAMPCVDVLPIERQWSQQQEEIFTWFQAAYDCDPSAHLVVRARAGTGKTTTIIEGVNRAPESSIWVCAYSKPISQELTRRITNPNATAQTIHARGYGSIRSNWPGMGVAEGSTRADYLTDSVCDKKTPKPIRRLISLLHTKARDMHPQAASPEVLTALALEFDYTPDDGWTDYPLEYVVRMAGAAMAQAAHEEPPQAIGIDFADMIYLPLVWGLLSKDYDLVVVDEAQDMTLAQLTIAQRSCSGRICVVGDDKQAIYKFRGADTNSLDRLKTELNAGELPLTTTYRCCQAVVRRAQTLVPDIQADPSNPEGLVDTISYNALLSLQEPACFILSRLNAPLVSLTLALLKSGRRARMAGRDLGAGIQAILKKIGATSYTDIEDVLSKLDRWESKTCYRYANYGQTALIDRTRDQAGMLRALAEEAEDVDDLLNRINWLFEDVEGQPADHILCSSIHKAKGLETDRVYVLQESLYRRGWTQEEANLDYVSCTRAKTHLTYVTGVPTLCR